MIMGHAQDNSQLGLFNGDAFDNSISVCVHAPGDGIDLLLNAVFQAGIYHPLDPGFGCVRLRLDDETGLFTLFISPALTDPCLWQVMPWNSPQPMWTTTPGDILGIGYEEETFNVPVGSFVGNSPTMLYRAFRKTLKVAVDVVDTALVVTTFNVGWTVQPNKFNVGVPLVLGPAADTDIITYTPADWDQTQPGEDPFRITVGSVPLLRPMRFRVKYWYLKTF
jgi:hypothetical protein